MQELENNYSVVFKVHNQKSKAWATTVSGSYDNERTAEAAYYGELNRLLGSADFDVVCVYLMDTMGFKLNSCRDDRIPPEPEPQTQTQS